MATRDDMPRHDDPTELEPRPRRPSPPGEHSTTAQLRRDIESGATGDKVAMLDPASTPLGTDDEAAGHPPSGESVAAVRRTERRHVDTRDAEQRTRPKSMLIVAGLVVLLGAIVAWLSTF